MNFKNILQEIEKADPEVYEKLNPRRQVLKSFGAKVAVAALPFAIGSLFKKAYAGSSSSSAVITALNFALELEFLEYNFYHTANNTGSNSTTTLIPSADAPGFLTIETHEKEHIIFLNSTITALGGVPYTPPNYSATALNPYYIASGAYDFTVGGAYATFSDYAVFLDLAQAFEDTGVRAYKGQLRNFLGNSALLTQVLQVHDVEARHAAHVRLVRRFTGAVEYPKPWITNNIAPTITPSLQAVYNGEDNTVQDGVTITSLPDSHYNPATIPTTAATEAFDETLTQAEVTAIVSAFIL